MQRSEGPVWHVWMTNQPKNQPKSTRPTRLHKPSFSTLNTFSLPPYRCRSARLCRLSQTTSSSLELLSWSNMAAGLCGTWDMVSNVNFDGYMVALGECLAVEFGSFWPWSCMPDESTITVLKSHMHILKWVLNVNPYLQETHLNSRLLNRGRPVEKGHYNTSYFYLLYLSLHRSHIADIPLISVLYFIIFLLYLISKLR